MVESISDVLFDLIVGFGLRLADAIGFAALKALELFGVIGGGGPIGFIVGLIVLVIIVFLILKFIFHSAFTIIVLVIVLIVLIVSYGYFDVEPAVMNVTNST
jgi:hypothetical protein